MYAALLYLTGDIEIIGVDTNRERLRKRINRMGDEILLPKNCYTRRVYADKEDMELNNPVCVVSICEI